jgi:hypothetical protein
MLRSINSTFKRKPKKRVVSRSFRIPPEVDRMLDVEAAKRDWSKSFLIKDILVGWLNYQKASRKVQGVEVPTSSFPDNDPGDRGAF